MRKLVIAVIAIAVLQAVFIAVWSFGRSDDPPTPDRAQVVEVRAETELDGPAPNLRYITVDGEPGELADHRARPVVVHFWATWCPPCVDELPRLFEWARAGDIVLLAVSVGDGRQKLREFFDGEVPDEVVIPVGQWPGEFSPSQLPVTLFVDADGQLVRRWSGAREWTDSERRDFVQTE